MTAITVVTRRTDVRRYTSTAGLLVFVAALGYLVLMPLYRLQAKALAHGGAGYRAAFDAPNFGRTLRYTIGLAVGSLLIALVLGTLLAWAASRLPRRLSFLRVLPIMPIVVPAIANVIGWAFLFSPRPGYLNALLRKLPWWSHLTQGPVDVYTMPWIIILTGFGLTSFVYLFVSAGFANISAEHIEAAQVAGSSSWGVFFKVILPLLRPTLTYGGGVALLLGLGQFTGPLLLGTNSGIDVITTNMYRAMSDYPAQYGTAAALGSPLLVFGIAVVILQKVIMGDQRRFVTHGGKAFRAQGRPSKLGALGIFAYSTIATILPLGSLLFVSLSKFWTAEITPSRWNLDNFREIFDTSTITDGTLTNSGTINSVGISKFTDVTITNTGTIQALSGVLNIDPFVPGIALTNSGFIIANGGEVDLINEPVTNTGHENPPGCHPGDSLMQRLSQRRAERNPPRL